MANRLKYGSKTLPTFMNLPEDVVEFLSAIADGRTAAVVALARTDPRYRQLAAKRGWSYRIPITAGSGFPAAEPVAGLQQSSLPGRADGMEELQEATGMPFESCERCGAETRGAGLCIHCVLDGA